MTSSRVFKVKEHIRNIYYASKAFVILKRNKKFRLMNKKLKERIMLSITEVNGCTMCSFVHTKLALSSGMSNDEIQELLIGNQPKKTLHKRILRANEYSVPWADVAKMISQLTDAMRDEDVLKIKAFSFLIPINISYASVKTF